ncbi:hypothetical protein [Candidatus Viadribacter manganicus]|uniref:hypothetical protein n=1 Tax=Candidatus Viadribacter manganicus TaxID=1759059 RepID=UPI0009F41728
MQRGQPANAMQAFDAAISLDPTLTTATNNRRMALAMTGQYDAALAARCRTQSSRNA